MTEPSSDERVLGIVGGTGPESTIDYYRSLIASWRRRRPDGSYPRLVINSVEAGRLFANLASADLVAVGRQLGEALSVLAAAGCEGALLASNASHLAFERIEPTPKIPLIHIVDAARDFALRADFRRLGLLGTRYVMESEMYPSHFEPAGLQIVVPTPDERAAVHEIYFGELVLGVIHDESRDALGNVVAAMRDRDGIDAVILGGTELALILTEPTCAGVPVLDTAHVHVETAVDWLLGGT
jgi:aspartate racemase